MVHASMAKHPAAAAANFPALLAVAPALADSGLFLDFYTRKLMLKDPSARTTLLLPDVKRLPDVILTGDNNDGQRLVH